MSSIAYALCLILLLLYIYGLTYLMPNIYNCLEKPNVVIPYNILTYEGDADMNYKNGNGTIYFYDKTIHYKGSFYADKYHGVGRMYNYDGSIYYEGVWFDGYKLKDYDFRKNNQIYYNHYDFYAIDICIFNAHNNAHFKYKNQKIIIKQ
jgi:hypothetical protein